MAEHKHTLELDASIAEYLGIRQHEGYEGVFTRREADGAIPNGSRVEKRNSETSDGQRNGALGTVLGSIHHPAVGYGYFIEWDAKPRLATFVGGVKVRKALS